MSVFISRTVFENHKMTLLTRRQTRQCVVLPAEFTNWAKSEIACQKPCFPSCRVPPDSRSHGKQAIFQKESGACVAATCLGNKFLSCFSRLSLKATKLTFMQRRRRHKCVAFDPEFTERVKSQTVCHKQWLRRACRAE